MNDIQSVSGYIATLVKFPDEDESEQVARAIRYARPNLVSGRSREAVQFILDNANSGLATTSRMLSEAHGIDVDQEGLYPGAIDLYYNYLLFDSGKRKRQKVGQILLESAKRGIDVDLESLLAELEDEDIEDSAIMSIDEQTAVGLSEYKARMEELASGKKRMAFPWEEINTMVPFIYDDDMILLTGESKTGKSSAAHQIAMYNAARGIDVLYFHNEDTAMKLMLRRIAQAQLAKDPGLSPTLAGTITYRQMLSTGVKDKSFLSRLAQESDDILKVIGNRITYVYCAGWTADQIISVWRRVRARKKIGLVVIDYLNKIESYQKVKKLGSLAFAMENNVETFKREAGRLGKETPCLLVQQDNSRTGTVRDTQSSFIKSQLHIRLTRDETDMGMSDMGYIHVVRANDGATGKIPARFFAPYMVWIA